MIARAQTLYHTLRFFSARQLVYLFVRRVLPATNNKLQSGVATDLQNGAEFFPFLLNQEPKLASNRFHFLNQPGPVFDPQSIDIDWRAAEFPKLWRYNLHYFDWLKDPGVQHELQAMILDHWIANNPVGVEDAWEPYTASLRIVNWIKYFTELARQKQPIKNEWLISLTQQCHWLEQNMEFHIRANHLLKNYVALVFACTFFKSYSSDIKIAKILKGFRNQVEEQFLDDGGHYERSPMYHCICLEDLLDCLNILSVYQDNLRLKRASIQLEKLTKNLSDQLVETVSAALDYLNLVAFRNGQITLFSDSAFGIAAATQSLQGYARRLPLVTIEQQSINNALKNHGHHLSLASGFFKYSHSNYEAVVSFGEPSPRYQPGHTHCDLFSFELMFNGDRLIIDTGVYEYAPGDRRAYCRSTAAHNVMQVGELEQHQIWGEFRVGRRAQVFDIQCSDNPDGIEFSASHDGFSAVYPDLIQSRQICFSKDQVRIQDQLSGSENTGAIPWHEARSYLCFGPNFQISEAPAEMQGEVNRLAIHRKGGEKPVAFLEFEADYAVHSVEYFPEFGKVLQVQRLCLLAPNCEPHLLCYRIILSGIES